MYSAFIAQYSFGGVPDHQGASRDFFQNGEAGSSHVWLKGIHLANSLIPDFVMQLQRAFACAKSSLTLTQEGTHDRLCKIHQMATAIPPPRHR